MAENQSPPFGGIFEHQNSGCSLNADIICFHGDDLNVCATAALEKLDEAVDQRRAARTVFLATIELDVQAGRFADVVAAYFNDPSWDYSTRFFIAPVLKEDGKDSCRTGRFTFEFRAGIIQRILGFEGGFRWGSALRVGGVRVREEDVTECLVRSPFDRAGSEYLQGRSTFACACSADLDELWIWQA